jgi:hypothetical protein
MSFTSSVLICPCLQDLESGSPEIRYSTHAVHETDMGKSIHSHARAGRKQDAELYVEGLYNDDEPNQAKKRRVAETGGMMLSSEASHTCECESRPSSCTSNCCRVFVCENLQVHEFKQVSLCRCSECSLAVLQAVPAHKGFECPVSFQQVMTLMVQGKARISASTMLKLSARSYTQDLIVDTAAKIQALQISHQTVISVSLKTLVKTRGSLCMESP